MKKLVTIQIVLLISLFLTLPLFAAGDVSIPPMGVVEYGFFPPPPQPPMFPPDFAFMPPQRILEAPSLIKDKDGTFRFILFGDSRSKVKMEKPGGAIDESSAIGEGEFYKYKEFLLRKIAGELISSSNGDKSARISFALFTGDLVWQGDDIYYNYVKTLFPSEIRGEGKSPARLFPVPGNHELWSKPLTTSTDSYFRMFPYLHGEEFGREKDFHYYAFYEDTNAFVTLCTGGYRVASKEESELAVDDPDWLCRQGTFEQQMMWLEHVLEYGVAEKGIKNVFVQYHKPSFSNYKHPPLKMENDPVNLLNQFKMRHPEIDIFVINGHNHTTELYKTPEGVVVLVAGGGGAPQEFGETVYKYDKPIPDELFWDAFGMKLKDRIPRVNYFVVEIKGPQATIKEMVLTNVNGKLEFEDGVTITGDGTVLLSGKPTGVLR